MDIKQAIENFKPQIWTVARYLFIAVLAYLVDIGVYCLAYYGFHNSLIISNIVGKVCTAIFGFLGHKYFTFQAKDHRTIVKEGAKFGLAAALNVPFATAMLVLMTKIVPYVLVAKVMADSVSIGVAFLITRLFVFRVPAGER